MSTSGNPQAGPRLSFIIPFYASHNKLDECVRSLTRHSDVSFEILILDDGNADYDYGGIEQEPSVRLIRATDNCGPSYRRNEGIRLARGTYIQFIDSDDMLVGNVSAYFDAVAKVGSGQPDVITGLLEGGHLIRRLAVGLPRETSLEEEIVLVKLGGFTGHLYRREFLCVENIEFPADLRGAEDTVFLMRVWAKAKTVLLTDTAHYRYRAVSNSLSKPSEQSGSPDMGGSGFEMRFGIAAGYVTEALAAFPAAQLVRGTMMYKFGSKGLQRIARTGDDSAFISAFKVLAGLVEKSGVLRADAGQIRNDTGVYWDDRLQLLAEGLQGDNKTAVRALCAGEDFRLY